MFTLGHGRPRRGRGVLPRSRCRIFLHLDLASVDFSHTSRGFCVHAKRPLPLDNAKLDRIVSYRRNTMRRFETPCNVDSVNKDSRPSTSSARLRSIGPLLLQTQKRGVTLR